MGVTRNRRVTYCEVEAGHRGEDAGKVGATGRGKPRPYNTRVWQGDSSYSRGIPLRAIHFKEDVLRVNRSRRRSVILSAAKDLQLPGERSFAALRMTLRDGLYLKCIAPCGCPREVIILF